jgi:hypothetical protein
MKNTLLVSCLLLISGVAAQAQRVISYQVLPANPTPNDNVRVVLAVQYANCGFFAGTYSYTLSNNAVDIRGCYGGGGFAIGCIRYDTVGLGRLPAGTYTIASTSHIVTTDCATAPIRSGSPNATGVLTVGAVLATRQPANRGQLYPTVLAATAATVQLVDATRLRQVSILDVAGREQFRFESSELAGQSDGVQLSLPNGLPGLYFLRATNVAGQISTYRFVRQ